MPNIKSAKKRLRQEKKHYVQNKSYKTKMRSTIRLFLKTKTEKTFRKAVSWIDKSAKKHIIHANKAARIKSKIAKLLK